jgi:hypothetical protein
MLLSARIQEKEQGEFFKKKGRRGLFLLYAAHCINGPSILGSSPNKTAPCPNKTDFFSFVRLSAARIMRQCVTTFGAHVC